MHCLAARGMAQRRCASESARRLAPVPHRYAAGAAASPIFRRLTPGGGSRSGRGHSSCPGSLGPRRPKQRNAAHPRPPAAMPCHRQPVRTGRPPASRPVPPTPPPGARPPARARAGIAAKVSSRPFPSAGSTLQRNPLQTQHPRRPHCKTRERTPAPARRPAFYPSPQSRWHSAAGAWVLHWRAPRRRRVSYVHFMF